jgi:hypothetical protein
MADNPENITERQVSLEEARRVLLREQLDMQFSFVESLKEALGVKTRLTEAESTQLKTSKEIAKLINSQDASLTSLAEKQKQIAKNKKLIAKGEIAQSLTDNTRVGRALELLKAQSSQAEKVAQMKADQIKSGEIDEQALRRANSYTESLDFQLDNIVKTLSLQEQAALYQQAGVENLKKTNEEREKELKTLEDIEDNIGLTGALLQSIGNVTGIKGIADSLDKVRDKLKETVEGGDELPNKFKTFGMILVQVGADIAKNLVDPLVVTTFVVDQIVDVFKTLDTLTSGTARNFGISNDQANELNKGLTEVATTQEGFFGTTSNLNATFQEINNRYGTFAKLSGENLKTFTRLTKEAGISGEALGELQDTTFLTGKTLEEQTVEYKGQVKILKATTGLALNEKQILEGIKDVSAATKLTLGGSAEAIATAVFKAKALGLEMKDLAAISSSLLNFQSSIEDELSAELLTGKQLNLERARAAALADDQATLAEELANNFGTAAEFGAMNVIQQEAAAKAVGLTRDTLAQSLMKREALSKLSQFEGETEKEKYKNAVELLGVDGARQKLGNDALADQMESVSMQERMTAAAEKFQEALIPLAEKVMPAISGLFDYVGKNINGIVTAMKVLISLAIAYKAVTIATSVAKIAGAAALSGGAALAIASIATISALGLLSSIGDGIFPAGGRAILSPTEGGLIPISNNDDIVVAPKLAQAVAGGGNTSQNIQNKVDISPSNTNITLNLNGQAIGNANARQNYGVGKSIRALGGNVDYSASV